MKKKTLKNIEKKGEENEYFSDCYLQTVNPWAISAKLLKDNPDMPLRVAKALTFSVISDQYMRLVVDEEHKEQQENADGIFDIKEIEEKIK